MSDEMLRSRNRLRADHERNAKRSRRDPLAELTDERLRRVAADAGPHGGTWRCTETPGDRMRKVVGLAERRLVARNRILERAQRTDAVDLRDEARIAQRI